VVVKFTNSGLLLFKQREFTIDKNHFTDMANAEIIFLANGNCSFIIVLARNT